MLLEIPLTLEITYSTDDNDRVNIQLIRFPCAAHNLVPWLNADDLANAHVLLQDAVDDAALAKAQAIIERHQLRGDAMRDAQKDNKL